MEAEGLTPVAHLVRRVLLARLLMVYGPAAPDLLRRIADELELLERERLDAEM